jgi:hypothetical protein
VFNSTLRKLPGMLANPLAPEDLAPIIDQNDADIGSVAVFVKHGAVQEAPKNWS